MQAAYPLQSVDMVAYIYVPATVTFSAMLFGATLWLRRIIGDLIFGGCALAPPPAECVLCGCCPRDVPSATPPPLAPPRLQCLLGACAGDSHRHRAQPGFTQRAHRLHCRASTGHSQAICSGLRAHSAAQRGTLRSLEEPRSGLQAWPPSLAPHTSRHLIRAALRELQVLMQEVYMPGVSTQRLFLPCPAPPAGSWQADLADSLDTSALAQSILARLHRVRVDLHV